MSSQKKSSFWSSYWMEDNIPSYKLTDHKSKSNSFFDRGILNLASSRRAIKNFVTILTNKNIPVRFYDGESGQTDGKVVWLSGDINEKKDFDHSVGLALHEASHIVLTDFDLVKTLWGRISELNKIGKEIGLSRDTVKMFTHTMCNYIEDRYIDDFIFRTAPGYRPYYVALYEKYFNNSEIGEKLKSNVFREPTLLAYEARILNLTNPDTDLDALPGLLEIAKEISLSEINRLSTCKDRIKLATTVSKMVLERIRSQVEDQKLKIKGNFGKPTGKVISFDIKSENDSLDQEEIDVDELFNGAEIEAESSNIDSSDVTGTPIDGVGKDDIGDIIVIINEQRKFLDGQSNVKRVGLSEKETKSLDIIENSGIVVVNVGNDLINDKQDVPPIECIVVKKMTAELLDSEMFPFSRNDVRHEEPISKGLRLGRLLGKRLQIRQEVNVSKHSRRISGKIDRRILADIANGLEAIFYKTTCDRYNKLNLHISVDASGSMEGIKWHRTMIMVTAICKAATMVDNIKVRVSLRGTITVKAEHRYGMPYVVMAYDSVEDKISKIQKLFPRLFPSGSTPEGLVFEATINELLTKFVDETSYFLTISDGEPCYDFEHNGQLVEYGMTTGGEHTRKQYKKILQSGVKGLAYFIEPPFSKQDEVATVESVQKQCFRRMYGKDSKFIDVENIVEISKTLNDLFLVKG